MTVRVFERSAALSCNTGYDAGDGNTQLGWVRRYALARFGPFLSLSGQRCERRPGSCLDFRPSQPHRLDGSLAYSPGSSPP
jgi:hypothetical protein